MRRTMAYVCDRGASKANGVGVFSRSGAYVEFGGHASNVDDVSGGVLCVVLDLDKVV
jgi:hypothetical protein